MTAIQARLYLLFTPALCQDDPWNTLEAALAGGVDWVQWRVKIEDPAGLERCARVCARRQIPLIVNDQVEAAAKLKLAGAHIGQDDMTAAEARRLLGGKSWLGISTHDLQQVKQAEECGADYLGFGPMYPTATKGYRHGQPMSMLRQIIAATDLPVFAIGGIDPARIPELRSTGCSRVAVSRCILQSADPESVALRLRELLA